MSTEVVVRPVVASDVDALMPIVEATLFPAAMLEAMIAPFLAGDGGAEIWLTCEERPGEAAVGAPLGVAYGAAERMTEGTWNLLAIGVRPDRQGLGFGVGVGSRLLAGFEARLRAAGDRVLIVETSARPAYEQARSFYRRHGFREVGRIPEFYAPGDDKIIFYKSLDGPR